MCEIIALLLIGSKPLLMFLVKLPNLVLKPAVSINTAGVLCSDSIFPLSLPNSSLILKTSSTCGVETSCKIKSVNAITLCFFGG